MRDYLTPGATLGSPDADSTAVAEGNLAASLAQLEAAAANQELTQQLRMAELTAEIAELRTQIETPVPSPESLPTAAELSDPGSLQAYFDASIAATGVCQLPPGTITINAGNTIVMDQLQGARLVGAGPLYTQTLSGPASDWDDEGNASGTRLVSTDGTGITFGPVLCCEISDLAIEGASVGLLYTSLNSWQSVFNHLNRVTFIGCTIGLQAGLTENEVSSGGVAYIHCVWHDCGTGVKLVNHASVNHQFSGNCAWRNCDLAINAERGSAITVRDSEVFGAETFLKIGHGGSSWYVIDSVRFDREQDQGLYTGPLPTIIDAENATSDVSVRVIGCSVIANPGDGDGEGWRAYRFPAVIQPGLDHVRLVADQLVTASHEDYEVLPYGGSFADTNLGEIEADIAALEGRATASEGDITSLNGRVTTSESDITALEGRATSTESDVTAIDSRVTTNESDVTAIDGRVTTNENDVTAIDARVSNAEGNVTSLNNRVTTSEGDITSLEGRATTSESDITALEGRATTSESDITSLEGRATTTENDVTALDGRVTTSENDVTAIDVRVTASEGNITALDGRVTASESDVTSLEGRATTSESDITALEGRATATENDVTAIDGRVTAAEGDVTALDGRVTTNESDITSLEGRATASEGDITSLDGRVTTNEGDVTALDVRVTSNEVAIASLDEVPTAAALSQPGALQAYVDACIAAKINCQLPSGTIQLSASNPLTVQQKQGFHIRGRGMAFTRHDQASGWNGANQVGTTRIVSIDGTGITWGPVLFSGISDLTIEDATVGITHPHITNYGSSGSVIERVGFMGCGTGLQAGVNPWDSNCADMVFRGCLFRSCNTGFRVQNSQGVNYIFESLCYWFYCDRGIDVELGGSVAVRDAMTYGGNTFMRLGAGFAYSANPLVIDRVTFDRKIDPENPQTNDPLPVIFDGSAVAGGSIIAEVTNCRVNSYSAEPVDGHLCFRMPANHNPPNRFKNIRLSGLSSYADHSIFEVDYV